MTVRTFEDTCSYNEFLTDRKHIAIINKFQEVKKFLIMSKIFNYKEVYTQIIRRFCRCLADDAQRIICFLLSRDISEREICKYMHIRAKNLVAIKQQLADGLHQAGIALSGKEIQ